MANDIALRPSYRASMKILSLFDGMACGMLAFQNAAVPVDRYVAFEIDKFAIKTATHNFPEIEEKGDVFDADFSKFSDFDFLIGGSPCTYWSIAQTAGRETEASGLGWELFSQYVRALNETTPKYFIYENNKSMDQKIRRAIDEAFGFGAVEINSALVSAQARKRLYWVGKRNAEGGYQKVEVEQPVDRGIILADVIDGLTDREKTRTVMTSTARTTEREYFVKLQGNMVFEPKRVFVFPDKNGEQKNSQGMRVYDVNAKSITLSGNGGGLGAKTGLYCVPKEKGEKVFEIKNGLITIKGKQYPIALPDGTYTIRKLTVAECKRLQTVPEWYDFSCVSNTQAYKMLGNGWTVEVIKHLICSALGLPTACQKLTQITIDDLI